MSRQDVFIAIRLGGAGEGSEAVAELAKRLGALEDQLGETQDETEKTTSGLGKMGGIAKSAVSAGFQAAGLAAAKFVATLGALIAGTDKALDAFREQDEVNRDVADSLRRAGLEGEALQERYDALQASAAALAGSTLFGDEDILAAQARYIQLTGDAALSTERLNVILGIAAKEKTDTKAASERYAKALKGEVDSLKDITPLTKKQAEQLNAMKDETQKAALAEQILADAFAGTAQAISPTFNATKNLSDAKGDLAQKVGEVIEASGVIPIILDPVTKAFRFVESSVNDNAVALQHYILDGVQLAVQELLRATDIVEDWSEELAAGVAVVKLFGLGLTAIHEVFALLVRTIGVFVSSTLSSLIGGFEALINLAAQAAEAIGDEGLAQDLRMASKAAESLRTDLDDFGGEQIAAIGEDASGLVDTFGAMGDALGEVEGNAEMLREGASAFRKELEGANKQIVEAKKNVKGLGQVPGGLGGASAQQGEAQKKIVDQQAKQAALQERIANLKLQAVLATDAEVRAALEYQIALAEIDGQQMGANARRLAETQAEIAMQETLADLRQTEAERIEELRKQHHERELERIEEQKEAEQARLDAVLAAYDQLAATSIGAIDDQKGGFSALAGAIGATVAAVGRVSEEVSGFNVSLAQGAEASSAAIAVAGQAAAAGAKAAGASVRKEAILLGFFSTALAAAAIAKGIGGNPAGFVEAAQHGVAAAAFFSTAAKAGGGGAGAGASAPAGASATGGASPRSSTARVEDAQQRQQDMLSDTLRDILGNEGRQITVINDNRGALFGSQAEDEVARMTQRGLGRAGMDVTQLRSRRR